MYTRVSVHAYPGAGLLGTSFCCALFYKCTHVYLYTLIKDWCRFRIPWTEPLQRKAIVFNITKPLCMDSWRQNGQVPHDGGAVDVAGHLADVLGGVFATGDAAPSSNA